MVAMFDDEAMPELQKYYDFFHEKYLYIPSEATYEFDDTLQLQNFLALVEILETSPLVSPFARSGDDFFLEFDEETLVSVMDTLGVPVTSRDIQYVQDDIRSSGLSIQTPHSGNSIITLPIDEYSGQ